MSTRFIRINRALLLSALSFFVAILVSFFSYRYLWQFTDKRTLALWFSIYEAAQLFLLLDAGFTYGFIRRNKESNDDRLVEQLPVLRGQLVVCGAVAGIGVMLASCFLVEPDEIFPYMFLSFSILITLLSYAETAALRVREKFTLVYTVNILSAGLFVLVLVLAPFNAITNIAVATLARSLSQYLMQIFLGGLGYRLGVPALDSSGVNVFFLNFSYFIFFIFDGFFLVWLNFSSALVAMVIVNKKIYDVFRGLCDSLLQVLSIGYAKTIDPIRDFYVVLFVLCGYIVSIAASKTLLELWLGEVSYNLYLSLGLGVSALALTIYRNYTSRVYFQGYSGYKLILISAVTVKVIFFGMLYFFGEDFISAAYLVQAILIFVIICILKVESGWRER